MTASPVIETGQLERALSLARQLAAALRGESSGVAVSSSRNSDGAGGVGTPRAGGGPVKAGVSYPVGGKGVEVFTPGADGFITPNGGGGNNSRSAVVTITNHFHGGKSADAAELARTLDRQLNRAAQTAFSGVPYGDK